MQPSPLSQAQSRAFVGDSIASEYQAPVSYRLERVIGHQLEAAAGMFRPHAHHVRLRRSVRRFDLPVRVDPLPHARMQRLRREMRRGGRRAFDRDGRGGESQARGGAKVEVVAEAVDDSGDQGEQNAGESEIDREGRKSG